MTEARMVGSPTGGRGCSSEVHLNELLHGLGAIVWEAEATTHRLTFLSRRAEDLLGCPCEEWLVEPRHWFDLVHPDDRERAVAASRTGGECDFECRAVASRGPVEWLRAIIRSVPDLHTRESRLHGLFVDITPRKRREARDRLLLDVSAVLASSLDCETMLQRIANLVVPLLAEGCIFELPREDGTLRLVALAHADPTHQEWLRERFSGSTHTLRSPHPADAWPNAAPLAVVSRGAALDGCPAPGTEPGPLLCTPLRARGRLVGVMTLVAAHPDDDLDRESVALSEELARRVALAIENLQLFEQAQAAIRVRDEILLSTSHELRTPLSHIKGFVSTLRQGDVEWDEETRHDFLREIEHEADRLAVLVADLLEMSRIESGGLDLSERMPTPIAALVEGGLDRVRGLLGDRVVLVELPLDLPPVVVDAAQLERVIANLLDNAAKYAPPGPPIQVRAHLHEACVEIAVEDSGPGIPPDQLEHIFERFVRLKPDGTGAAAPGTGLGLAICRAIVQAHGGLIRAENRPEGGARFSIWLRPGTAGGMRLRVGASSECSGA